mmetsp:Transcript_22535/g.35026  ORF Transcript_22535/g.35026 Transcript_22535/m.35026 type:complete len:125 (+) Transcript_22535:592-966(+)
MENLQKWKNIVEKWKDSFDFAVVYIQEAHPTDGWSLKSQSSNEISTHKSLQDRVKAALHFSSQVGGLPCPLYCDSIEDYASNRYGALPERLWGIHHGKIAYEGGIGPHHYSLSDLEEWMEKHAA